MLHFRNKWAAKPIQSWLQQEDFFLQKWLQSVSSVHCSNTDPLVTPTLQSPNYSPRKVPPAPTQHPLRTLSTRRSRRETSGKCVTGRLPKGGTHFRLSSLTTPDNLFSLNKFLPARAVPFCKKEEKHRQRHALCLAAKLYFEEIFHPKILSPGTHPHHVTLNMYYCSVTFTFFIYP